MNNPYANELWRDKNWPKDMPRELQFAYQGLPLSGYVEKHGENFPDRDALVFYGKSITYKQLNDWANSFAQFLLASGIGKGDVVALFMPNTPAYVIAYMGVSKVGAITSACSPAFKEMELEFQLKDSGAKILVCLDEYLDVLRAVKDKVALEKLVVTGFGDFVNPDGVDDLPEHVAVPRVHEPGALELLDIFRDYPPTAPGIEVDLKKDVALMQYTGGTTGLPKGALHTYHNVIYKAACRAQIAFYDIRQRIKDIRTIQMAPIYHIAGLLQLNCNLYEGITQVMLSHFTPQEALKAIDKFRPQYMSTVTKMNTAMLDDPDSGKYDLSCIEKNMITSVGLPLTKQIVDAWKERIAPGSRVAETAYGLTETHTGDTFMPLDRPAKFGPLGEICCGIPTFGTEFKIVSMDDRSQVVPIGERGEIAINGPANFIGYWNKPEETADTLVGGWLYTGDTGKFDEDGYFYWLGRKKEMIKVSGYSVFPDEVEMFLNTHPAVDCSGVTSVPDENKGQVIKAVVVLKDEYKGKVSPEEIIAWSKDKMSFYKVPKLVEIRDALPRSGGTNKILRRLL
ncbi:MAG: AMP-binding protein [Desulfarculaceae bacterium]|nr:AMP-binding protein [Desulfarculaceae bacterium]MCF8073140.1 AMP-binding protein [Desulfarculaceae bacterium]MCF8101775.1 AMP-binding protein [Desulfarculaceae bacterium]MCF8117339.1 AMP-binding protein [Desulfarculaceae bacterium]